MVEAARYNVNSPSSIVTLVALGALTSFVLIIAPGLVGAFISELGLSPKQGGYLISADMAGMGVATLPAMLWLNRVNWRLVAAVSLASLAVCHLISASLETFKALLIIRFAAGLLGGTAMSVCLASLAMTENPDRNFGFWVVGQLCVGAAGLAIMPYVLPIWGVKSVFLTAAIAIAILVLFVRTLPEGHSAHSRDASQHDVTVEPRHIGLAVMGIAGLYIFYIALSGVWSYLERIGDNAGLSAKTIGFHLSIASVMGIAGALSATALNKRFGRMRPGVAGFVAILVSLVLLLGEISAQEYLISAALFKFAWTFVLPFLLTAIANTDKSGRAIVIANIFIGGGLATGPALAALMISGVNYTPVVWLGITGMVAGMLLFLPAFSFSDKTSAQQKPRLSSAEIAEKPLSGASTNQRHSARTF